MVNHKVLAKADDNKIDVNATRGKKLPSANLFGSAKELMIEHQNEIYYLRITKQNKLILTK